MGGGYSSRIKLYRFKTPPAISDMAKEIRVNYPGHVEFDFVPDTLRDFAFMLAQECEDPECATSEVASMLNCAFKSAAMGSGEFTLDMHYSEWESNELYDAVTCFFTEDKEAVRLVANDASDEYLVLYDRPQLLAAWQKIQRLLDTSRDGDDVIKVLEFVMDAVARRHCMSCSMSAPP